METETMTTGPAVVIDSSRANAMPTGRVVVGNIAGLSDREVADLAGYGSRHFGFDVTRYDDGTAAVSLWND